MKKPRYRITQKTHYRITQNLLIGSLFGIPFIAKDEKSVLKDEELKLYKMMRLLNTNDKGIVTFKILNIEFLFFLF